MPNKRDTICILDDHLPIHKVYPNVPEAFKDKYFSKREIENLMELEEIIS